ncbi:MAG TPA: ABC transporter permease [candidate division Zixibacteria bacterium]|nr:ABC transporter permease [candidate division Zixibacteria bacterium]
MTNVKNRNHAVKAIFRLFLKTSRKRLIPTILASIIIFTLLSTFLLTWFNYRYKSFYNTVEYSYDWCRDGEISVIYGSGLEEKLQESHSYFDLAVNEVHSIVDEIAHGMFDKYTASMYCLIDSIQYYPLTQSYSAGLLTLQQEAYEFLAENLIEGRMPSSKTELIYRSCNNTNPIYNLGDKVGLKVEYFETLFIQNFTIVGIIGDFSNNFYQEGFSNDIFSRFSDYQEGYYQFDLDLFFTAPRNFVEIMSFYPAGFVHELTLNIDFDYQISIQNFRNIKEIVNKINDIQSNYQNYEYLPSKRHVFCLDLEDLIFDFQKSWSYQTVKIFASGIPAILLFSLICIEIFNIGNYEKSAQFRLFKLYGLEFRMLRRILLAENFIIASLGLFFGVLLGTLFGYFFTLGIGIANFGFYLNAFLEPVVFVAIIVLFTALFVGGYVIELLFAKKTVQLTFEIFKSKRKKRIRKFLGSIETILFLLGVIIIGFGVVGWIIFGVYYSGNSYQILSLEVISIFFIVIGALLVLASTFLIFSRLVVILWRFIGEQIWKRRKGYFTLALKQLSIYSKDFQRTIFAMFMICLCVTPGLILTRSLSDHLVMEANHKVGFSDLLIQRESNNFQVIENISSIDGVELVTGVEVITLQEYGYVRSPIDEITFNVGVLNIYNVSEFVEIISPNFPRKSEYSLEEISTLETNMTYMMSSKYAHREKYDRGRIYSSSEITNPYKRSYEMTFVNIFDSFPLLPYKSYNYFISLKEESYNLVMSNLTTSQIMNNLDPLTKDLSKYYILAKIYQTANKTAIIEEIKNLPFSLSVVTYEEELNSLQLGVNEFRVAFFTVVTIIALFALLFFGFLSARNIYTQRLRIIESEYQVGAKRFQIWGNFSIEFSLVVFIPLLISMLLTSIILHEVFGFLLEIPQTFKKFVPWLPVWLMGLIILFCITVVFCGWLLEMMNRVNKYRPTRQE